MSEKRKSEISNCPFCGHTIFKVHTFKTDSGVIIYNIHCSNCGCSMERLSRNEVILAWNNRRYDT